MPTARRATILAAVLLCSMLIWSSQALGATLAAEGLRIKFEGLTLSPNTQMTEGALNGWHEDDWIPMRLTFINDRESQSITVSVLLEYVSGSRIGIDAFASCFSDSGSCGSGNKTSTGSNWRIIAGSGEATPTVDLVGVAGVTAIRWTLSSVSIPQGTPVEVKWAAHLAKSGSNNLLCADSASPLTGCSPKQIGPADGARAWPGNSLQARLDQPLGERTLSIDPPREQQPQQQPQCVIATAAFGSELAAPVQFLREFRDHDVGSTVIGNTFIQAFNNWYYSWAPPVARWIAYNEPAKFLVRALIAPLLGALIVGHSAFTAIGSMNAELGILSAGVASSAIIGAIYLTPLAYLIKRACRRPFGRRTMLCSLGLGLVLAIYGTLSVGTVGLLEVFSSILVIEVLLVTPTLIAGRLTFRKRENATVPQ